MKKPDKWRCDAVFRYFSPLIEFLKMEQMTGIETAKNHYLMRF